MTVSDVFFIRGRGVVATGQIEAGPIRLGDQILVNGDRQVRVDGIEMFRKRIDTANAGDNVGLLVAGLDKADVKAGDVLTDVQSPAFAPTPSKDVAPAATEDSIARFRQMREAGLMSDDQYDEAIREATRSA